METLPVSILRNSCIIISWCWRDTETSCNCSAFLLWIDVAGHWSVCHLCIWCLTNKETLPLEVSNSQSSVLNIYVFWNVMWCHWKDCIACFVRVKGPLILWHNVTSQKTWIFIQCLMPRPWSLCSISYCCSVLHRWFWIIPTGKCRRQSSRYLSLQAFLHHWFTFSYHSDKLAYMCCVWPST